MTLLIGLPSKGRLMEKSRSWFSDRGVSIEMSGAAREYQATIGVDGVEIVLLSAGEIPRELAAGRVHMAVTGIDVVREKVSNWAGKIEEIERLGFGGADLVIAVPDFWTDVHTLADLDAVAGEFRQAHGHRLRIATKYHRLVREFLRAEGVADYQLVDSQGATEATVRNLTAEAVADITSTGDTLRANHLRPLSDGLILKSQATLFRSRIPTLTPEQTEAEARLMNALGLS